MLKHVYRVIILVTVFIGALVYFESNIQGESVKKTKTIKMSEETFPILSIQSGDEVINQLHGYSSNIEANLIRESITPIGEERTLEAILDEKNYDIKKINYEVSEISDNKLLDSGSIAALEKNKGKKLAKIRLKAELERNTEYSLEITAVTNTSKKIHYYTRIKYIENSHLKENLDFIMNFHNSILDKKKASDMIIYLEPDVTRQNNSLAHVDINSSFELVSFKNLNPKVVGEIVPTIKETNADVSTIELKYKIETNKDKKKAYYNVKEMYRVRYTEGRMYLLNYDRTMESIFDINLSNLSSNKLKIGISNQNDFNITSSADNTKFAFVKDGCLWYYDLTNNKMVDVFSFADNKESDVRANYDQHNTRILGMDDNGDIDFMVYGYMNSGYYEGKIAIILYKYYSKENRIEEQVYIPVDIPYQLLKENLDCFSYVNRGKVFYFSIDQNIYSYNIVSGKLTEIASNINNNNLYFSKQGKFISWQDNNNAKKTKKIIIMDLETGKQNIIEANNNENIKILGTINANIIFGYAKTNDITTDVNGSTLVPLYKVEIVDIDGNSLMNYEKKGFYVINSTVKDNIIELSRVKKSSDKPSYEHVKSDYILNQAKTTKESFLVSKVSTDDLLEEAVIELPNTFTFNKYPQVSSTLNTVINDETALHLEETTRIEDKYYVNAMGEIIATYYNAGDAIKKADNQFGVVLNKMQKPIWERGEKDTRRSLSGITPVYVSENVNSITACLKMLLTYSRKEVDVSELKSSKESMYETLKDNIKENPINLTGASLDEALYYVSKGYPIIAMKDDEHAVLITAYDEFNITVIDPSRMETRKIGLNDASKIFEQEGNIFVSYYK
ncbi:cysteine peptidase family C39 domain-containing protein [Anaeromicropila herbilytica]|uniref:Peptidase C39 domain-containing protein n=1 Tax=Anaeromicropila herbilytica TaxID=2785025 RepID=A0A7R7IEK6_9FIRM|nr:cysteine peptidase family C39 domain-containing protein [Anaeromicropila herbilytica]BCN32808.1 hypothetical protein bsdtb5_41030 [Anaeromicropila herbilytica]